MQEFPGSDRALENPVEEKQTVTFRPQPVHHRAGQNGGVDVGALEPLVQSRSSSRPARHILLHSDSR
jgi:hypothetical protein